MEASKSSLAQVMGDVCAKASVLAGAQADLVMLEIRQNGSQLAGGFVWIALAVLLLLASFTLLLTAILLAAMRLGFAADVAAAVMALVLGLCGSVMAALGRNQMRRVTLLPSRAFASICTSLGLGNRSASHD